MDFLSSAAISASGMEAERVRLDVSALNLANAHTTRTADGGVFRPLRAIIGTAQIAPMFSGALAKSVAGVEVQGYQELDVKPRLAYEPGHPDADKSGFVAYPGVNSTIEMLDVLGALRAYESNVAAFNAAKSMAIKALDIGGRS